MKIPLLLRTVLLLCLLIGNTLADNLLSWGEPDGGLQLAAVVESGTGVAHGWVRNGTSAEVTANIYFLGYFESVGVEVREADGWKRLERSPDGMRAYAGAGPGESDRVFLRSFEILKGRPRWNLAPGRSHSGLPTPTPLGASLGVDLGDFTWPAALLQQAAVEMRIVQRLSGPGLAAPVTLRSPSFAMDGPQLREILDRISYGMIFFRNVQDRAALPFAVIPPDGTTIFARQFPGDLKLRIEKAAVAVEGDSPLGRKAYACDGYAFIATLPGGRDELVWGRLGPSGKDRAGNGVIPFEAVEHDGRVSVLYTWLSELWLGTFSITAENRIEKMSTYGLGSFSLRPEDKAVGFRKAGKKTEVVFTRSPDGYPRSNYVFEIDDGKPIWRQMPAKKLP